MNYATQLWAGQDAGMGRARPLLALVVLGVMASFVSACTSGGNAAPRGPVGAVTAGLERFYGQALSWGACAAFGYHTR